MDCSKKVILAFHFVCSSRKLCIYLDCKKLYREEIILLTENFVVSFNEKKLYEVLIKVFVAESIILKFSDTRNEDAMVQEDEKVEVGVTLLDVRDFLLSDGKMIKC